MAYDEKIADRIRQQLGARKVVEKKMMGRLAFMVNGTMALTVGDDGLLVRVTPDEREALVTRPHVTPMVMGKRTMSGFVRVAPAGFRTAAALAKWIEIGIAAGAQKRRAR